MKSKRLFKFELIGIFVIFALGCLWHFLYEFSNESTIVGIIAPVNESMWEHWKLGIYPILLYSLIEYFFVKREVKNFLFSKFISILIFELICFSIASVFNFLFNDASMTIKMIIDISAYFLGILIGQIVSYIIACKTEVNNNLFYIAIIGILIHIIVITLFTFNPPKMNYFKDQNSNEYGIYKEKY